MPKGLLLRACSFFTWDSILDRVKDQLNRFSAEVFTRHSLCVIQDDEPFSLRVFVFQLLVHDDPHVLEHVLWVNLAIIDIPSN